MEFLTNEQIIQSGPIGSWYPSEDRMSGTLEWTTDGSELMILATPNWNDDGMVPVEVTDEDGDTISIVNFEITGDVDDQLKKYRDVISVVAMNIYEYF